LWAMQQAPMPPQQYQQPQHYQQPQPAMPQPPQLPPDPQFGYAVSEWRAGMRNRILIAVLIVICGGLVAIGGATSDNTALLVIALVLSALALAFTFVQQAAVRVVVYTHGIERFGLTGKQRLGWDTLQSYTLNIVDPAQTSAGAGVLVMLLVRLFTKKSQKPASVVLRGKDASKVTLSNTLKGYDSLIESLVPYLADRLLAAARADLGRGVPVSFGPKLVFDPAGNLTYTGLFKKQYVLPYANIAAVNIERAAVLIVQRDTGKTWQSVNVRTVPNVGVLQRLIAR